MFVLDFGADRSSSYVAGSRRFEGVIPRLGQEAKRAPTWRVT